MFAMKYMNKHQCIERDALKNVLREVDILTKLEHPFLVNIWFSFQEADRFTNLASNFFITSGETNDNNKKPIKDEEDLFMVTDLLLGGDLRYHIQQAVHFSEDAVKLMSYELGLALDYLQSKRIIHRDIKPENILLDEIGHFHITDFNIATVLEDNHLATSMSGTKPYIAPEIFECAMELCVGYSYAVDWWSLGVVAFEMLCGVRPFDIHSNTCIQDVRVLFQIGIEYPGTWSESILELVSRLLCVSPGIRISNLIELKQVSCLHKYDMGKVLQRLYHPPFQPPKDHLNCDPTFELEEMIVETKPLHKKKKRLAKQRSIREIQNPMSLELVELTKRRKERHSNVINERRKKKYAPLKLGSFRVKTVLGSVYHLLCHAQLSQFINWFFRASKVSQISLLPVQAIKQLYHLHMLDCEHELDSESPMDVQCSMVPDFKMYNRYQELERRERENKEQAWERELETAMKSSDPLRGSDNFGSLKEYSCYPSTIYEEKCNSDSVKCDARITRTKNEQKTLQSSQLLKIIETEEDEKSSIIQNNLQHLDFIDRTPSPTERNSND